MSVLELLSLEKGDSENLRRSDISIYSIVLPLTDSTIKSATFIQKSSPEEHLILSDFCFDRMASTCQAEAEQRCIRENHLEEAADLKNLVEVVEEHL